MPNRGDNEVVSTPTNGPELKLLVTQGHVDQELKIRLTPAYAEEFRELAEAQGLQVSRAVEFTEGPQLFVWLVSGGGPIAVSIGVALKAFFERHKGKSVTFGDDRVEVKGYSAEDVDRIVEGTLNRQEHEQRKLREQKPRQVLEPPATKE